VRTEVPTSEAWATSRNGSLPALSQSGGHPAFQLRLGDDLSHVSTPLYVRPDTCATSTFWSRAFADTLGVRLVPTVMTASGVGGIQKTWTTEEPVAHVFGPGTPEERCIMVRPLVVEGVKEEQFQVLLGIDVLHAVGACLDMSACRLSYQADRPGLRGHCAFTMSVPASLLLTSAAPSQPAASAQRALDELYPLVPLDPPGQAALSLCVDHGGGR
jgi:hypothetical protein